MIKRGTGTYICEPFNSGSDTDITFGNYCSIAVNLTCFSTANHPSARKLEMVMNYPPEKFGGEYDSVTKKDFTIGNDVWIGTNVTLMGGCDIGDGAIVGAYSVVRGKIPPYSVCIGNPATVIKYRFDKEIISKLLRIKWWNWEESKIKENLAYLYDIKKFIKKYD